LKAWDGIIHPTMTTRWPRLHKALIISTPRGYDDFYTLYMRCHLDPHYRSFTFDYNYSPYLDPQEIERARNTMDPILFAREYMASFAESGNQVFHTFDRKIHVKGELPWFGKGEDIYVGIDFNVNIMAAFVAAKRGNELHCLKDFKGFSNTEELAKMLVSKFPGHRLIAFPDPTGNANKSSATIGQTDFSILRKHKIEVKARNKSPSIRDSVNAVNSKLMTASGNVGIYFGTHTLKHLVPSVERTVWKDNDGNSLVIDKSQNIEHWSDALRYMVEYLWPVNNRRVVKARGKTF